MPRIGQIVDPSEKPEFGGPTFSAAVRAAVASMGSRSLMVLGDSFMQQEVFPLRATDSGYTRNYAAKGSAAWLSILSNGALRFNELGAWGRSGQTSAGLVAQIGVSGSDLASANAYGADDCILNVGTNDPTSVTPVITEADSFSNIKRIVDNVLGNGKTTRILVRVVPPRAVGFTAAQKEQARRLNQLLKSWSHPSVAISDCTGFWIDYSSLNGDPVGGNPTNNQSAYTIDGIHPGTFGAYLTAQADLAAYKAKWGPLAAPTWLGIDPLDVFSNTNPRGNRLVNGQFTGTGGTALGGVTGSVAASWTVNRSAGDIGVVASVGTLVLPTGETVNCQTATIAPSGSATAATTVIIGQTMSTASRPAIGKTVRVSAYIKVTGVTKLADAKLIGADVGAVEIRFNGRGLSSDTSGVYYPSTYEGLHTFDFKVQSASVDNQFRGVFQIDVGSSGGTIQMAIADYRVID